MPFVAVGGIDLLAEVGTLAEVLLRLILAAGIGVMGAGLNCGACGTAPALNVDSRFWIIGTVK